MRLWKVCELSVDLDEPMMAPEPEEAVKML